VAPLCREYLQNITKSKKIRAVLGAVKHETKYKDRENNVLIDKQ
jgi:hypothetical protein